MTIIFKILKQLKILIIIALTGFIAPVVGGGDGNPDLDTRVGAFLESHRTRWVDMNVPESDGKLLYDLIIKHNYQSALEIGTSTGRSAIWMAWALSKTGGKLITIEIDEGRNKAALKNFEAAGLTPYIDARLADAHELVKVLEGPFDFVFSDADKGWYTNYFKYIAPKMTIGGAYTAHNMSMAPWNSGIRAFIDYVSGRQDFQTTIDNSSRAGLSISYKIQHKSAE